MSTIGRILCLLILTMGMAFATVVGRIEAKGGEVRRIGADGQPRTSAIFAHVEIGDTFVTGSNGWVVLSMVDSASLTLKPNTRMRIGDYNYTPDDPKKSNILLDLLTGSLRSITGLIGHRNPEAYQVTTPTVTMGIRGTDHEILVVTSSDDANAPAGTYDHVYDGRTVMHAATGDLDLVAGETALASRDGKLPFKFDHQPAVYDHLQQFSAEKGIDGVLGKLHKHSGHGYTLSPNAVPVPDWVSTPIASSRPADSTADTNSSSDKVSTGKDTADKADPATSSKTATSTDASKAASTDSTTSMDVDTKSADTLDSKNTKSDTKSDIKDADTAKTSDAKSDTKNTDATVSDAKKSDATTSDSNKVDSSKQTDDKAAEAKAPDSVDNKPAPDKDATAEKAPVKEGDSANGGSEKKRTPETTPRPRGRHG